MLQEIPISSLQKERRYFVKEGNRFYFGTVSSIGEFVEFSHAREIGKKNVYRMYFNTQRYFQYNFYRYVPMVRYSMEQKYLNKILQTITGDDTFFYSIMPL